MTYSYIETDDRKPLNSTINLTLNSTNSNSNEFRFSGYTLDVDQRKLFGIDSSEIKLSSRAFDTLLALVEHRGETLSKDYLMKAVWPNVVVEENNLNQAISSLRKALGDSKNERRFITSVPGRGYRFVAQLDSIAQNSDFVSATTDTQVDEETRFPPHTFSTADKKDFDNRSKRFRYRPLLVSILVIIGAATYLLYQQNFYQNSNHPSTENTNTLPSLDVIPDSIAVLPFTELNSNSDDQLFSIGLHDEVINQLSKIRSLSVISRDSVIATTGQQLTTYQLIQRLKVESLMTGTVLFAGDHARVSLQLLEPRTGVTLWATTYDADTQSLSNMIAIQSDIAVNVARALEAEINQTEQKAVENIPTLSFEAYRYHLAAKNAYYQQDYEKTWNLSRQALELDPNFIDALYTFSYVNTVLRGKPLPGINSEQHFQLALSAAEKIITLSPDSSAGYSLKASALSTNREWLKVTEEVERLKSMGVPLADMKFYGVVLLCLGDFDGAREVLEDNLKIEPVNLYGRGFLLLAYELTGQRELARAEYQLGEELSPLWWGDTTNVFITLSRNEPLSDIDSISDISDELKNVLKNLDDREKINSALMRYSTRENKFSAETVYYSALAAHIGEHDMALELIRQALDMASLNFHWLWLPIFDQTRQQPGFKQLLIDTGIFDYWNQYGWQEVCQPNGSSFSCDWKAYP